MVMRKGQNGKDYGGNQRVNVEEAIKVWTLDGAYATFEQNIKGSITPGKLADFTIVRKDPRKVDPIQSKTSWSIPRTLVASGSGGSRRMRQPGGWCFRTRSIAMATNWRTLNRTGDRFLHLSTGVWRSRSRSACGCGGWTREGLASLTRFWQIKGTKAEKWPHQGD
jgi:hypothetical protein